MRLPRLTWAVLVGCMRMGTVHGGADGGNPPPSPSTHFASARTSHPVPPSPRVDTPAQI
jgi:hypothetical protein